MSATAKRKAETQGASKQDANDSKKAKQNASNEPNQQQKHFVCEAKDGKHLYTFSKNEGGNGWLTDNGPHLTWVPPSAEYFGITDCLPIALVRRNCNTEPFLLSFKSSGHHVIHRMDGFEILQVEAASREPSDLSGLFAYGEAVSLMLPGAEY